MAEHANLDRLNDRLDYIDQSPADKGLLRAIVIRPATDQRESLQECELSPELGVHGDNWAQGCWLSLPDGRPHPEVQVTLMNARVIELLAGSPDRWELAGDNLYVDLDLGVENLPVGQRLQIGSVTLEITDQSHTGCKKFAQRYGADAVKFVNSPEGKRRHLRGIYAKILEAGRVRVGDPVCKV